MKQAGTDIDWLPLWRSCTIVFIHTHLISYCYSHFWKFNCRTKRVFDLFVEKTFCLYWFWWMIIWISMKNLTGTNALESYFRCCYRLKMNVLFSPIVLPFLHLACFNQFSYLKESEALKFSKLIHERPELLFIFVLLFFRRMFVFQSTIIASIINWFYDFNITRYVANINCYSMAVAKRRCGRYWLQWLHKFYSPYYTFNCVIIYRMDRNIHLFIQCRRCGATIAADLVDGDIRFSESTWKLTPLCTRRR